MVLASLTLALGACGRKAGLDQPPSASAAPASDGLQVDPTVSAQEDAADAGKNVFAPAAPGDRSKYAPRGPKKRIIIDPILD